MTEDLLTCCLILGGIKCLYDNTVKTTPLDYTLYLLQAGIYCLMS